MNLSQQALAFDVNAEVEPIPQDEAHNDLFGKSSNVISSIYLWMCKCHCIFDTHFWTYFIRRNMHLGLCLIVLKV